MVDEPTSIPLSIPSETFSHIYWSNFIDSSLSYVHIDNKVVGKGTSISTEPNLEAEANVEQLPPQRNEEFDDTIAPSMITYLLKCHQQKTLK